jgi:hypothetical protein
LPPLLWHHSFLPPELSAKIQHRNMRLAAEIVSGINILPKVMGVPIAAGLYLSLAVRGGWRKSAAFAAGVLLFCQPHVAFNSAGSQ